MTQEKWQDIKMMVKEKFKVLEERNESIELRTGLTQKQIVGNKEVIIFLSPIGKVKLDYLVKPVILEKKEHYSKRMGASAQTEYVLSNDEFSRRLEAYLWKDNDWQKIDSQNLTF